jgi:cytochrome c
MSAKPYSRLLLATALAALACGAAHAQDQTLEAGRQAFQECMACHSVKPADNGAGPSLAGIFNSKAATVPGFEFSGPMKRSGLTWDEATLDKFLADPQAVVPGTRMPYSGMTDTTERAALIKYLETLK